MSKRSGHDLAARQDHLKVVYTVSQPTPAWKGPVGRIDDELIREHVPILARPLFYVSGPKPMVEGMANTLLALGIKPERIKQDAFPGYES